MNVSGGCRVDYRGSLVRKGGSLVEYEGNTGGGEREKKR
jgi:hypothetical protein